MRKGWTFVLSMSSLVLAVTALFVFFILAKPPTHAYVIAEAEGTFENPVYRLTTAQAREHFNSTFVLYLLYAVQAYNLHAPPLSTDLPRMNVFVDEQGYGVVVDKGRISVSSQPYSTVDLALYTSKDEAIRLLRDTTQIPVSFQEGRSNVILATDSVTLLSKGYMHVYRRFYSPSFTGNIIRLTFT